MTSSAPISSRQLVTALLTMAVVFIGPAGTATADQEWDVDAYDKCMAKTVRDPAACCLLSGGNVGDKDPNVCTAPAALEQDTAVEPTRPTTIGGLPTLAPAGTASMPGQAAN